MACEGADEPRVLQKHCLLGLTPRHASIMGEPIEDSFKPFARLVLPPIFQVMADKPLQQMITRRLLGGLTSQASDITLFGTLAVFLSAFGFVWKRDS